MSEPSVSASTVPRRSIAGYGLYLIAATLFALNGSVATVLLGTGISPARLSQLRVTAAFLILLVVVALTNRPALRLRAREIPHLLVYSVLGIAMTQYLYYVSLDQGLEVGVSLLIEFTAPIMVALWFRFRHREDVKPAVWIGLVLALVGLALVAQVWQGMTLDTLGVTAAFGAAVALAIYYVAAERGVTGESPRDPVSLTMWGFGAAAVFWAIVQPWWTYPWEALSNPTTVTGALAAVPVPALLTYQIVLGTVVPFWLVLSSMKYLRAAQAATVGMSEPVIAIALAWLLLNQSLDVIQVLGGCVVLLGVLIAERSRNSGPEHPTPAPAGEGVPIT